MKIFISTGMKDKSDKQIVEDIKKLTEAWKTLNAGVYPLDTMNEVEFVDNFEDYSIPLDVVTKPLYYRGLALMRLSTCDEIIAFSEEYFSGNYKGVELEINQMREFGKTILLV